MTTNEEQFAIDESEFERDVTAIVRKVLTQEIRNVQINLEDQLTEKLQDILKRKETEKVAKNSRLPIQVAPMVVIPYGMDGELAEIWAYTAAQEGKWVALVYSLMAEVPKISDALANGNDVRTVSRAYGQQSITFKNGGRILWLAKDLKGGRGVSVNLVLRVEGRGEGAKLCMRNEEKFFRRQAEPKLGFRESARQSVLYVLPIGPVNGISKDEVIRRIKSHGGVILEDGDYANALYDLVADGLGVKQRFFERWLYYRDA